MTTKTIHTLAEVIGWILWIMILAGLALLAGAFLWLCGSAAGVVYALVRSGFTFALNQLS